MARKKAKSPNTNRYKKKTSPNVFVKYVRSMWPIIVIVATLVGLAMDLGGSRSYLVSLTQPKLEVNYFTKDPEGHLLISDKGAVDLNLTQEDIDNGTIQVPLNLAIRNLGSQTLEDVRIHVKYGKDFEVIPMGTPKIDVTGRQLIYEHNVGLLEPIDTYTPLETIDVIRIPFTFRILPIVALAKGEIPIYFQMLLGAGTDDETEQIFALDIDIFSKGRRPIRGTVYLRIPLGMDVIGDDEAYGEIAPVTHADETLFLQASTQYTGTIEYWEKLEEGINKVITYKKIKTSASNLQVIYVDQQVRRLIVDEDSDQLVDYELYAPADEDGTIYKIIHPIDKKEMVVWLKEPTNLLPPTSNEH